MKLIRIKDIGEIVSGSTPKTDVPENWNGTISWATPKDISVLETPFLETTEKKITQEGYKSCSTHILPRGSILFTSRAPIGLVGIANIELCTNQGFKSIIVKEGFYPLYIYYALKYSVRKLKNLGTGTTFKELSKAIFENFELPIPSYEEQIRIAVILHKTENLILQRKKNIDLLDYMAQNEFIKLFGDPFLNNKNLKKENLGMVCNVTKLAGYEYTKYIKYKAKGDILAVRGLNVKNGKIKEDNAKYIDRKTSDFLHRSKLYKDDIVMTYIGVNIGDTAIIKKNDAYHLAPNVAKITSKDKTILNPVYLLHALMINKTLFFQRTNNTAKQSVNMGSIRKTEILIPKPTIQKSFSEKIGKIEQAKAKFEAALVDYEKIYNSLMERVFRELRPLKLNKFPLSVEDIPQFDQRLEKKDVKQKEKKQIRLNEKPKNLKRARVVTQEKIETLNSGGELLWESVSAEQIATWIKSNYDGFDFSSEMAVRFLQETHLLFPDYHSSEDLKKKPHLNESDDLKSFIFSAVNGTNPFLKLKQIFYDASQAKNAFNLTPEDYELIEGRTEEERSGIYFNIEE